MAPRGPRRQGPQRRRPESRRARAGAGPCVWDPAATKPEHDAPTKVVEHAPALSEAAPPAEPGAAGQGARGAGGPAQCSGGETDFENEYEAGEVLGRGAYGVVLRAIHRASGRPVAVKRLPADAAATRTEVATLSTLDHANIVGLTAHYATGGELLLVQDLCAGGSLEELMQKSGGALPQDVAAPILRQVLQALQHCHARGFAHQDVKVDNVMFATVDRQDAKLIDFGLADAATAEARAMDAWMVGAMLFQVLTGWPFLVGDEALEEQGIYASPRCPEFLRFRLACAQSRVSPEALQLLTGLLCTDAAARLSVEAAAAHAFLQH